MQVSWASTMIINSSKAELVYAGDYHTRMEERVDELIMRPLTKAEEFNASKKILAATSAAEIIEIIDEIMKIQQDAIEDGEVPPDLDVISLHRLALESISRLAQGSVEQRDRATTESVDFILDTIESFRSEVDVVTLALQVVNEFNLSQSIDTADVYNLLLDCIQFFSPEAPDYRPKKIPKRLRPPEEDPLLMGLMSMQASKGGGESTRGGDSRSATHRSDHTTATGAFSTLTGRTDDPTPAPPAGSGGMATIPADSTRTDTEAVAHADAAVGLPLIAEKSSEEGDDAAAAEVYMPTLTLTVTRESTNPNATLDTASEPPIPIPSDAATDAHEKTAHTLPPLPIAQSARSTKQQRDKTISRREARRLAMEEEEQERERIRLEAEAAMLAEQGGEVTVAAAAAAAEQAPNTTTQGAISTLTATTTATAAVQGDLTTIQQEREGRATGTGPPSRQGRRTVRAATPGTPSGKQDAKAAAAAAKTKGWKGTKGSTDS